MILWDCTKIPFRRVPECSN